MRLISEREETDQLYGINAEIWAHLNEIEEPTMVRNVLLPKNNFNNHFLHRYTKGDFGVPALHDHPWWSISFLLYGELEEIVYDCGQLELDAFRSCSELAIKDTGIYGLVDDPLERPDWKTKTIPVPRILIRPPGYVHSLQLKSEKAATYFITGKRIRNWGFYTKWGWIPYWYMAEFSKRAKDIWEGT